jgi:hypothetical protein
MKTQFEMEFPPIATGAEISRIGGGVEISQKKTNEKYRPRVRRRRPWSCVPSPF